MAAVLPFLDTTDLELAKQLFADFYALEPVMDTTSIRSYMEQNSFMDPMMVRRFMPQLTSPSPTDHEHT